MMYKPVYLFTGFLGSGKTTFIRETLENHDFGDDGRTLLLICEEGETEYKPENFVGPGVRVEIIQSEDEINPAHLSMISAKGGFDRIVVEYNGMWEDGRLYQAMPRNWAVAQNMAIFDATTFEMYNRNMRQLCFNKMQNAEMVVFNRCEKGFDKMPFHKAVRVANKNSVIVYEYSANDIEIDDIEDPLPYDLSKSRIEIKDEWYAEWYRDLNENEDEYNGKTFVIKGVIALADEALPNGQYAFGRNVMTCCEADIQFAGLLMYYSGEQKLKVGDWVEITSKMRSEFSPVYKEKGPVLYVKSLKLCEPPEEQVATF